MIVVQAEFTKASRLYLLCQNKISDLYKLQIGKKDLKKDELLKQFDYLLQVMLMYIALIDSHVSPIELNFIDLITVDGDCLKELNKQKGTSYTWDNLCDSFVDKDSFNKFVDETAYLFELKTNQLIMFLASVDAFTDEYEINYFDKAYAEDEIGFSSEAIDDYTKYLEDNPDSAVAYNNRGWAKKYSKDYSMEDAIEDYNKAIDLESDNADYTNNRAIAYYENDEYEKAIADWNKVLEINPEYEIDYFDKANAEYKEGFFNDAILSVEKHLSDNFDDEDALKLQN